MSLVKGTLIFLLVIICHLSDYEYYEFQPISEKYVLYKTQRPNNDTRVYAVRVSLRIDSSKISIVLLKTNKSPIINIAK